LRNNFTLFDLALFINFIIWFPPFQSPNLSEVLSIINLDYKYSEVPGPGQYK